MTDFIRTERQDGTVEYVNPRYDELVAEAEAAPVQEAIVISDAEIAEYDSQQYARDRAAAYPSQNDQNDMAYWDRQNGTTTLDDAILAVKAKYPKTGA